MDISKQKKFLKANGEKLVAIGFLIFILQISLIFAEVNELYVSPFGFLGGFIASFGALGQLIYYKDFFDKPSFIFKILKLISYFLYLFLFVVIAFVTYGFFSSLFKLLSSFS